MAWCRTRASVRIVSGGLVLASPILIGQVWGFIAPGLYPEERRWAIPFVLFSVSTRHSRCPCADKS